VLNTQSRCLFLNTITLGQHKSDNNNRIIQLTDTFCEVLNYDGPEIFDYNKRLIQLAMIQ
jgi:hypothetical protein